MFLFQIPVLGSEALGHYRARLGAGSLLTSSVRVVGGGAGPGTPPRGSEAPPRGSGASSRGSGPGAPPEPQPRENGRSVFYIDPTTYSNGEEKKKLTKSGQ